MPYHVGKGFSQWEQYGGLLNLVQYHPVLSGTRLVHGLVDFVEKKRKSCGGDLTFPGKVVRNSANLDTFIATQKRADSLRLDFSVTRKLEWAVRGKNLQKIEGGAVFSPQNGAPEVRTFLDPLPTY